MRTLIYYYDRKKVEAKVIENIFKGYSVEKLFSIYDVLYNRNRSEKELKKRRNELIESQIDKKIAEEKVNYPNEEIQIIFFGTDNIVRDSIKYVKNKYNNIKIKLIFDTYEGLIFDQFEMKNFSKMLELAKNNTVEKIYFFKKSIAKAYKKMGYNAGYIMQNYNVDKDAYEDRLKDRKYDLLKKEKIVIGAYPSSNYWNSNIYNIYSVSSFFKNAILKCKIQSERDIDFIKTYNIDSTPVSFSNENIDALISNVIESDVVLDLDFTTNNNINFLIAASFGIPCLIGNNNDLFIDLPFIYSDKIVTNTEDNPYENSEKIKNIIENIDLIDLKEKLIIWKKEYDKLQKQNLEKVIGE